MNPVTVACLMPTIPAHQQFLEKAMDSYHSQLYPNDWDVFLYLDGGDDALGTKINRMVSSCLDASPRHTEYFVLLDSDDLPHPTRIQRQIQPLIDNPNLAMTGTSVIVFRDVRNGEIWKYTGNSALWI